MFKIELRDDLAYAQRDGTGPVWVKSDGGSRIKYTAGGIWFHDNGVVCCNSACSNHDERDLVEPWFRIGDKVRSEEWPRADCNEKVGDESVIKSIIFKVGLTNQKIYFAIFKRRSTNHSYRWPLHHLTNLTREEFGHTNEEIDEEEKKVRAELGEPATPSSFEDPAMEGLYQDQMAALEKLNHVPQHNTKEPELEYVVNETMALLLERQQTTAQSEADFHTDRAKHYQVCADEHERQKCIDFLNDLTKP